MTPDQFLGIRFYCPELGSGAAIGPIARLYFTGLASYYGGVSTGVGNYALTLGGDGIAYLWELTVANSWAIRKRFVWSPPSTVTKAWHAIYIRSDAYDSGGGVYKGSVINIQCMATQNGAAILLAAGAGTSIGSDTTQYYVPQGQTPPAITIVPPRVDIRRDIRALINISYTKFQTTGTLTTNMVQVPVQMGAVGAVDRPIFLNLFGSFTTGTGIAIDLRDSTGASCSAATALAYHNGVATQGFTRNAGQQSYYAIITFNANSSQSATPIVKAALFVRNGAVKSNSPTTFSPKYLTSYSIAGAGADPQTETATFEFNDYESALSSLTGRSGHSVRHTLTLPDATQSILFIGKALASKRFRRGVGRANGLQKLAADKSNAIGWPAEDWSSYIVTCAGLWDRLNQAKCTTTFDFSQDQADPQGRPWKVTDAISLLLSNAGLPSNMYDVPDLPIRLLVAPGDDASQAFRIEVYAEIFPFVLGMVQEYLGGFVTIDYNATNGGSGSDKFGCVRVKFAPRPDAMGNYKPLANFVTDATWTDVIRSKFNLNSYPSVTVGSQVIKDVPIRGKTLTEWIERPEGNMVYVTGTVAAAQGALLAVGNQVQLNSVIHNWPAAYFSDSQPIAPDTTSPDYTDGTPNIIVVVDPGLTTQAACDLRARRIFDLSCHARHHMSFEAPLALVMDAEDDLQIRKRKLMYGDPVTYNGETWFVSSCVPDVGGPRGGTRNSTAMYELFQVPVLQDGTGVYAPGQAGAPTKSQAA